MCIEYLVAVGLETPRGVLTLGLVSKFVNGIRTEQAAPSNAHLEHGSVLDHHEKHVLDDLFSFSC